ncbi:MAG TPA: PD-(D/E)XK nuclease family protein [Candidatus Dormibacteraeota bacterium]
MTVRATRLRPGPAAEAWLSEAAAELKGADPLGPLTVVVPNQYAKLALRRRLAATGYANVRHEVLARVAESLGAPGLAAQGKVPLTAVTEEAAIRSALRAAGGLGAQTEHRAVIGTLRALFRDIAEADLDVEHRGRLGSRSQLARVAMAAHDEYLRLLAESGLYDRTELCRAATEAIDREGAGLLADWGSIVLYLPTRLSLHEIRLLGSIARVGRVEAGLSWLDDPVADADPSRIASFFGLEWDTLPTVGSNNQPNPEVLMAPDAGEEVRAAVRRVIADLEGERVPLHRTALVYRHQEPYQQLVRETLEAAQLPWVGLGGKPISESFAGRGLLGLLHLQGQRFSRGAVLNWLSSLPHGGDGPSLTQWDRISRKAGVVRGVDQWADRLQRKLDEDRATIEKLEKEDDETTEPLRSYRRSEAAAAEEMRRRIQEMDRRTRPPEAGSGWAGLASWALELRGRYIPIGKGWPAEQQEAAQLVDETIGALAAAAPLDGEVEVGRFVETLEQALAARRRPQGKLGQGVVTGSISAISGMTFDRVYVLGMTERAYPAPPPVDPIFPEGSGDLLGHIELRMAGERMNYLGALAAGGRAVLCFPTHDTEQRPAYPARWLLDAVASLAGRRVGPAELRELRGSAEERPWLTSLVSTEAALRHGPVMLNLPERRVNEAREIVQGRGDLLHSALAAREELPLGRGLTATAARASHEFTEFDGNVAAVAPGLTKLAGGLSRLHPISPSGVETWASCPFRYFLGRVLDVEPTERPEDDESWAISAIDRGSLIHAILEEFFRKLLADGRPALGEAYTLADRELLEQLAKEHFQRVESLGQTGYRLAWLNEQTAIQLDLRTVLTKDEEFRAKVAVKPEFFEQGFGWAEGWPAAEVALADGTVVRLRGYIDRVDLGEGEAYVTDYKTGSAYGRRDFESDPVVAGTKVQLAVYSNAVRRFLEAEGKQPGQVTASYWFISTKGNFNRVEVSESGAADQRLAEIMGVVNEGLTVGAFPQVPGEDQGGVPKRPAFSNCVFCDYNRICPTGRDQIRDRKKAEAGASLHQRLVLQ